MQKPVKKLLLEEKKWEEKLVQTRQELAKQEEAIRKQATNNVEKQLAQAREQARIYEQATNEQTQQQLKQIHEELQEALDKLSRVRVDELAQTIRT